MNIFIICIFTSFCYTYYGTEARLFLSEIIQDIVAIGRNVDINEMWLRVYTRADSIDGVRVNLTDGGKVAYLSSFDINLKTFIYIHGFMDAIVLPPSLLVKDALLNTSDVNVILVNWDKCAVTIDYLTSWQCVEVVGNYLGEFLQDVRESYNYSLDNVTIVGHSLGAHIAGFAGKKTNRTLGVIVGLDPAGPLYFKVEKKYRLSETDAKYVQAIHTCAIVVVGETYSVGSADFWPNGGSYQPGCGLDIFVCSHVRSIFLYIESISSDALVGRKCNSYQDYEDGKCKDGSKSVMGGINVDKKARGNYFLDTNDKSPFGKGDV